ncbi:response regulator transcription factor [uncultured Propionibacterium sp.]|uniref:response regulator transcription factor n=1 Tax=uncultured Propionibacterium sp. TaxID=218066 RepID=UPI00292F8EDE|nr:response regulator transcription factor [uncultured Propionibacterium sp.]
MTGPKISVVVVEDDDLIRSAFEALVNAQPDMACTGTAPDGFTGVELARSRRPDVVLMDIQMPRLDGISATARICRATGNTRVVVLTTFDVEDNLMAALRAGASGFLSKTCRTTEMLDAIRAASAGDSLISPHLIGHLIKRALADHASAPGPARPHLVPPLTPREAELAALVGRGLSNEEIAGALRLSPATVKTYVSRLLAKTGSRDRAQLVIYAYEHALA